ncbi:MAG: molybdopterin-dependent oxidoreductase, partial [Deltaproteobacteria bacterium]|nr:molybdopterin-dependent oxidoreductase [Deltaproteobacteria bacterium]
MYIEPQGMIAEPREDGGFNIVGSMQCPYYISKAIANTMGMPEDKFAIRQATIGGAFGGKEDYPSILAGYCAVLAHKAKRPVKIVYDRDEDTEVSTKRHPARMKYKTGVKKDGTITAMEIAVEMDAGAYVTMTPVVLSRGLIHSAGPYRCDNVSVEGWGYATNNPHSGAFRGFGAPQVFFALESHVDIVAKKLGMSPLEFRMRNMLVEGDSTATGQIMDDSCASKEVLETAAKKSLYEKKREEFSKEKGNLRRGMGMAFFFHGAAFTGSGEDRIKGQAGFRLEPDGTFTVLTACTDMGQGAHTVVPQMAADSLGVDLSLVGIETPDTSLVPNSGPTVASRTTMIMGVVMERAVVKMKGELFGFISKESGVDADALRFEGENLVSNGKAIMPIRELVKKYYDANGACEFIEHYVQPPEIKWNEAKHEGDAYPTYGWGCDVAEVEVDMDTFEVAVKKLWIAIDVGKAINPKMAEGQLEGGTLQSVGYGMLENFIINDGKVMTNRFQTYIIPTFKDTPEMETTLIEKPYKHGPMGAKGLGELPMNGGAPAVANAIENATGIRIRDLPVTPEKLFEAWRSKGEI